MLTDILARVRLYLRQQPVMLTVLTVLTVALFLFATALSRIYHAQREALGTRWFERGVADLKAKNYEAAVTEFRTSLLYSRDNFSYQLNLAESLIGLRRTGEASTYLLNLWEREPENGLVNLELARIEAQQGQNEEAVRYYHDAVYAAWPTEDESQRSTARLELIDLLLRTHAKTQAQAELIALSANAGGDTEEQNRIGELFLRTEDDEHALAAYRVSLHTEKDNAQALAGAGRAAFELGRYAVAQRYLQAAVVENPSDVQSAERLKTAEMVLDMDPFGRSIPAAQRDKLVLDAFATAGKRLESCESANTDQSQENLKDEWEKMKSKLTGAGLRRSPDEAESAMDLVFRIERAASTACAAPEGKDLALLLIAKLHEGG
jgi:tetratricopeptide (TPR) repeat protein